MQGGASPCPALQAFVPCLVEGSGHSLMLVVHAGLHTMSTTAGICCRTHLHVHTLCLPRSHVHLKPCPVLQVVQYGGS